MWSRCNGFLKAKYVRLWTKQSWKGNDRKENKNVYGTL